jgi:hypothetical protein
MMNITKNTLQRLLKREILEINFNKKDGTPRSMICSLKNEFLPKVEKPTDPTKQRPENPNAIAVWDIEKEAFRSFRIDSLIDYKILNEEGYEL